MRAIILLFTTGFIILSDTHAGGQNKWSNYFGIAAGGGASFITNIDQTSVYVHHWNRQAPLKNGYIMFVEGTVSGRSDFVDIDLLLGYKLNVHHAQLSEYQPSSSSWTSRSLNLTNRNHCGYIGANVGFFNIPFRNKVIAPYLRFAFGYVFNIENRFIEIRQSQFKPEEEFKLTQHNRFGGNHYSVMINYGFGISLRNTQSSEGVRYFLEFQRQHLERSFPYNAAGFLEIRVGIGYMLSQKRLSISKKKP